MKTIDQSITLLDCTADPEALIERIARVCYKSEGRIGPDTAGPFMRKLKGMGHLSMFEHAKASFHIVTSRAIANEIVRHRLASYAQESTRYCDYSKQGELTFIRPWPDEPFLEDYADPVIADFSEVAWKEAERVYLYMRAAKISPQIARDVLPLGLKTEIVMTANFREWGHFFDLRASPKAHPQIQWLAKAIQAVLHGKAPNIFD